MKITTSFTWIKMRSLWWYYSSITSLLLHNNLLLRMNQHISCSSLTPPISGLKNILQHSYIWKICCRLVVAVAISEVLKLIVKEKLVQICSSTQYSSELHFQTVGRRKEVGFVRVLNQIKPPRILAKKQEKWPT